MKNTTVNLVTEYRGREVFLAVNLDYNPPVNYRFEEGEPGECFIVSCLNIKTGVPFTDLTWLKLHCMEALEDKASALLREA